MGVGLGPEALAALRGRGSAFAGFGQLLGGSWDLVTRLIINETMHISTSNPN